MTLKDVPMLEHACRVRFIGKVTGLRNILQLYRVLRIYGGHLMILFFSIFYAFLNEWLTIGRYSDLVCVKLREARCGVPRLLTIASFHFFCARDLRGNPYCAQMFKDTL